MDKSLSWRAPEEAKSPVMLGVSEGAAKYMCGFKTVAAMVKKSTMQWELQFL